MRRGQATVELALCSLVFVTVLIFGIHFAELGAMKLRVQQAAVFATWQATGDRVHHFKQATYATAPQFENANGLRNGDGDTPEAAALERYRDFDGLRGTGNHVTWATTRGSRMRVRCDPKRVAIPPGSVAITRLAQAYTFPRAGGRDVDGVGCSAQGRIALFGFPQEVLDDSGGFFKVRQVLKPIVNVCAFGRARGGRCLGQIPFAIDDWGLAGTEGGESKACDFDCSLREAGGNKAYKQQIERLYEEYKTTRTVKHWTIERFVQELFTKSPDDASIMSVVPVDERDFRFAFIGEDAPEPFKIRTKEIGGPGSGVGLGPDHLEYHDWATTPYSSKYQDAYGDRGECFAGLPCTRNPFDKQHWR